MLSRCLKRHFVAVTNAASGIPATAFTDNQTACVALNPISVGCFLTHVGRNIVGHGRLHLNGTDQQFPALRTIALIFVRHNVFLLLFD
jgi:hypothetical protein